MTSVRVCDEDPSARPYRPAATMDISPATRRAIEQMAWETLTTPQCMLDRLLERGMDAWHMARQNGERGPYW